MSYYNYIDYTEQKNGVSNAHAHAEVPFCFYIRFFLYIVLTLLLFWIFSAEAF